MVIEVEVSRPTCEFLEVFVLKGVSSDSSRVTFIFQHSLRSSCTASNINE